MARRPADYTAQLQADDDRRKQRDDQRRKDDERRKRIDDRQTKAFGTVVMAATAMLFDIDALAGVLLESRERLKADPKLMEGWRAKGCTFFRGSADDERGPDKPMADDPAPKPKPAKRKRANPFPDGAAAMSQPEPGRAAAPRDSDLLGHLVANGTSTDAPEAS